MIRLKSIQDVMKFKDTMSTLAYIRGVQFLGSEGFDPEIDGWIVVLEHGDDITHIKEIGGIFDDDNLPSFEIIESFADGESVFFEILFALDSDRTIAVIAEQSCLDDDLRAILQKHSGPPQPMPTLNRRAL